MLLGFFISALLIKDWDQNLSKAQISLFLRIQELSARAELCCRIKIQTYVCLFKQIKNLFSASILLSLDPDCCSSKYPRPLKIFGQDNAETENQEIKTLS